MLSLARSPPISDSRIQAFQKKKTLHQRPPSSWVIRQWYKKSSEHRICQKSKQNKTKQKESEWKNIQDRHPIIIQHLQGAYPLSRASAIRRLNLLLNSLLNICWIPVRNALPFAFLFSFDRAGATNLFVFMYIPLSYGP